MKIILMLFLITNIGISQNVWEQCLYAGFNSKTVSIENRDSNRVYLLADQFGEHHAYIYVTTDKGVSWEMSTKFNYPNGRAWRTISVPENKNIYIAANRGTILKSIDSGKTYTITYIEGIESSTASSEIAMYNDNIGYIYLFLRTNYLTKEAWNNYNEFNLNNLYTRSPKFINDSTIMCLSTIDKVRVCLKINLNTKEYFHYNITDNIGIIHDIAHADSNNIFICGKERDLNGGSGNDVIYKSRDGGKTWRNVLDLYDDYKTNDNRTPFGLQSIAFRDSLVGIAVGQFGKFVYTYDGGETWIYETELHPTVKSTTPATMLIRYAGDTPIVGTIGGEVYRLLENNLAPKAEDIYTISGRVWFDSVTGQAGIPVALGARICMTDSLGFYRFTRVSAGQHTVRALNKYFDGPNPEFYYKPYDYTPAEYNIVVSSDTSGFDFNAIDLLVGVERFADKFTCDLHIIDNSLNINILSNDYLFSEITLFSSTGIEISQHKSTSPYSTISIDQLSTGIYFAKVTINNQYTQLKKFVVVR